MVPEFFEMARQLEVQSMDFTRFIPKGTGKTLFESEADAPLAPLDLRDALTEIVALARKTGVETGTDHPLYHLIDPELGNHGLFGFQGLVIDYKGNFKVSSRVNYNLGNVLSDGLEALFLDHPLMRSLRKGKIAGCGKCEFYFKCGGDRNAAYAATGNFLSVDPGCWIFSENKTKEAVA